QGERRGQRSRAGPDEGLPAVEPPPGIARRSRIDVRSGVHGLALHASRGLARHRGEPQHDGAGARSQGRSLSHAANYVADAEGLQNAQESQTRTANAKIEKALRLYPKVRHLG